MQELVTVLVMLVLLVSCKTEYQKNNSEDSISNTLIDINTNSSIIKKNNVIIDPQAPKRITRNIKLDKDGKLLIAAYDDIIRYDGESFTQVLKPKGLESWYAFDVLEDRKGNIWIASDQSGVFRINTGTGVVKNFTTKDGLGHQRNMCIYEDRSGNIWIGGQGGLSKYDGYGFTNFTKEDGLPHNDINTILEDKNGNLWVGTRGNMGFYDGSSFFEMKNDEGKPFFNVWSIIEDKSGVIWLVDSNGLWKYSNGVYTHELVNIWKIYEDSNFSFWFTGVHKFGKSTLKKITANSLKVKEFVISEIFKSEKMIFGIVEDNNGNIWMGGGDGIWLYNGKTISYYTGISND